MNSDLICKQPKKEDKDNLFPAPIDDCAIEGEWERNMTYTLRNHRYVSDLVIDISTCISA